MEQAWKLNLTVQNNKKDFSWKSWKPHDIIYELSLTQKTYFHPNKIKIGRLRQNGSK